MRIKREKTKINFLISFPEKLICLYSLLLTFFLYSSFRDQIKLFIHHHNCSRLSVFWISLNYAHVGKRFKLFWNEIIGILHVFTYQSTLRSLISNNHFIFLSLCLVPSPHLNFLISWYYLKNPLCIFKDRISIGSIFVCL